MRMIPTRKLVRAMCLSRSARAAASAIFTIMFYSLCGETCVAGAAFWHNFGKKISASEKDSSPGPSGIQQTSATAPSQLLSFAASIAEGIRACQIF